jgi:protein-S-isoprenylcysteine O-methyltransferase Ste14
MVDEERTATAARLFDVRRVIGGLFVVYGVIVTVVGLFDRAGDLTKAQGVRINLWTGLGMLVLGALFLLWQWWRPAEAPSLPEQPTGERPTGEQPTEE